LSEEVKNNTRNSELKGRGEATRGRGGKSGRKKTEEKKLKRIRARGLKVVRSPKHGLQRGEGVGG